MKLPRESWLEYAGRVPDEEKLRLLRGALALVAPSPHESLSIVTLEAFACGRPVLVYGGNPVLREHAASGGALAYHDSFGFRRAALQLLRSPDEALRRGAAGRAYVESAFSRQEVKRRLFEEIALLRTAPTESS